MTIVPCIQYYRKSSRLNRVKRASCTASPLPSSTNLTTMPPLRKALGDLNVNRVRNSPLSPYARGIIIRHKLEGASNTTIAKASKLPKSTSDSTITLTPLREEGHSQPRSGRPPVYTDRDYRALLHYIRLFPKYTYQQVRDSCGVDFSDDTIRRHLDKHSIRNWRCKRRLYLTEAIVAKRLA